MIKEIDVKFHIAELKDIERRISLKAGEMINCLRLGIKLDNDIMCDNEVTTERKESVVNNLKRNTIKATKDFLDKIIEEVDDISLIASIELANQEITPGYYQQLKKLRHKVLLTNKSIEQYNILELAKHIESAIRCIESSTRVEYNYTTTQIPKHSDKTRQYTVTKPARYVPFPMK